MYYSIDVFSFSKVGLWYTPEHFSGMSHGHSIHVPLNRWARSGRGVVVSAAPASLAYDAAPSVSSICYCCSVRATDAALYQHVRHHPHRPVRLIGWPSLRNSGLMLTLTAVCTSSRCDPLPLVLRPLPSCVGHDNVCLFFGFPHHFLLLLYLAFGAIFFT